MPTIQPRLAIMHSTILSISRRGFLVTIVAAALAAVAALIVLCVFLYITSSCGDATLPAKPPGTSIHDTASRYYPIDAPELAFFELRRHPA